MAQDERALRDAAFNEAAAWRIRLTDHRTETTAAFEAWLRVERNAEVWDQTQAMWSALEGLQTHPAVRAYRKDARRRVGRRRFLGTAALSAVAASVSAAVLFPAAYAQFVGWRSISTPATAQRMVDLPDGTHLVLDAGTRLRVRLSATRRDVVLRRGQARFDVAHDPRRPFRVHAGGRVVTALGTSFTVDRTTAAVSVALLAGRVSVADERKIWTRATLSPKRLAPVVLHPGQRVELAATTATARIRPIAPETATAWEKGRLVFDNDPLPVAAERASRYAAAPIHVGDTAAARLRVSGTFLAGDTRTFVEAVSQYFDLTTEIGTDGTITLRSRPQNNP